MKISEWVKNKRLSTKRSQKEFGMIFGLSHAAISDIETGKVKHISEAMLNFLLEECEHKERMYIQYTKCLFCGKTEEDNLKLPKTKCDIHYNPYCSKCNPSKK